MSTTLKSKHKTHMFTFYQNRHDFRLQSIYVKESLSYHFVLCNIDMIVCLFLYESIKPLFISIHKICFDRPSNLISLSQAANAPWDFVWLCI